METLRIEILNPKAKELLKNLADLKLINIHDPSFSKDLFFNLLDELRVDAPPSLDTIQGEVKKVRKQMPDNEGRD